MSYAKLYAVLVVAVVMAAGVGCIFSGLDDGGQSAQPTLAQQIEQTDVQNDVSVPSLTLGSPVLLQSNNTQTWTSGACTCTFDTDTGVFTVSGDGAMADYTGSNQPWYSSGQSITSLVVQSGVTKIGNNCFRDCSNLASADLGAVTIIGSSGFYNCTSLASVIIPNTVTAIWFSAFYNCTSLASVTIGNSVTSIGNNAIYGCTALTSVIIPSSVTTIGEYAFSDCTSLTSITFKTETWNITSIGSSAFQLGTSGTPVTATVYSPNNVANGQLDSYKGSYTTLNYSAFPTWTSGSCTCTLNPGTGEFVVSGSGAMADYSSTSDIPWYSVRQSITSVVVQTGVTHIGNQCFDNCQNLASINLGSVTTIGRMAFQDCSSLASATIPNSVTIIDSSAFGGCTSLTSVTIGDHVTAIASGAFYQCTSLTLITFTATTWNITAIGANAFSLGNPSTPVTATVYSPNNVANGHLDSYKGSYTTLNYASLPAPIAVTVLYGQHYEYTVTTSVPATVTISGSQTSWLSVSGNVVSGTVPRAQTNDTTLIITALSTQPQQITIQEIDFTLTTSKTFQIGDSLYQDVSMTGPTQPYSVDVRGTGASYTYTQSTAPLKDLGTDLTSITISGTPTVFNSCVFYQAGFTGLIIPDSVTTMAQGSFAGSSLNTVVLGNGLTSIPNQAFVPSMPPQGSMIFHDASGNTLQSVAEIRGHIFTLVSGHYYQYMADSQITVNTYNDATCYAVVGRTLQNSDADKLGFSAQLTAYSGTTVDQGVQTAWNGATRTITVNPAVGTSTVDSNGYLSGTAPSTTGTYNSTATIVSVLGGATITDTVAFHVYVEEVLVITSTPS